MSLCGFLFQPLINDGCACQAGRCHALKGAHQRATGDDWDIDEVWRRGTVIGSWLLDLTVRALAEHPDPQQFSGRVSDSGEVRWAAIDTPTRAPVLTAALCQRFSSRDEDDFPDSLLSAMRYQTGGHLERPVDK